LRLHSREENQKVNFLLDNWYFFGILSPQGEGEEASTGESTGNNEARCIRAQNPLILQE